MFPDDFVRYALTMNDVINRTNVCCICGKDIKIQIFKGTGVCSENCRKDRDNDHAPFRGGALSP